MPTPTIYSRIPNPYVYGTEGQTNVSTLYAPGELGAAFNGVNGVGYLRVQLDSGATSATPVGAVAAGQVAFWKSRPNAIVTNDKRFCDAGATNSVDRVAGFFSNAPTAGNYTDLVIAGVGVSVATDNSTYAFGLKLVADPTANTARVTIVANGTASPSQQLGIAKGVAASNMVLADVSIGFVTE